MFNVNKPPSRLLRNYHQFLAANVSTDFSRSSIPNIVDNVARNRRLFDWLRRVSSTRKTSSKDHQTRHHPQQHHASAAGSRRRYFHYDAVHLLDKSKLQFLGDAIGDYKHFSSYAAIMCGSYGHSNFVGSLVSSRAFNALILTPDAAYDNKPRMCNGKWSSLQWIDYVQQLNRRNESLRQKMWNDMLPLTQCAAPKFHPIYASAHLGFLVPSSMMTILKEGNAYDTINKNCSDNTAAATDKLCGAENAVARLLYAVRYPAKFRRAGDINPGDGNLLQALLHNALLTTTQSMGGR